ncbi:MAG TPA: toll/interleukin-1 receptor domain-containing protein, partial [Candidatus Methylacidiphilales bacterium]|nr:toll/interleukin-1 receptor domain-containing protein [Candidatus Methylacidiphilales bacterium]
MANASPEVAGVGTSARRIVFISHANPEQNDFTRWLGAQLANAGYEVWSDVTKLIGGEVFWDDIEDAIRNHAAKFVLAVSRAASQKDGVQDEVAVAVAVERGLKIKNFVIPCRIDDLEFSSFRANITRKNA